MRADMNRAGKRNSSVAVATALLLVAGSAMAFQQAQPGNAGAPTQNNQNNNQNTQPGNAPGGTAPAGNAYAGMDPAAMGGRGGAGGGDDDSAPKLKAFADVSKGYERVVSTADGQSFFGLWKRERDGEMLAEFPRGWEGQKHFIAMTVASGEEYAGLQAGDMYVYWKRFDNRLMLCEPNMGTRSTGDQESKSSVKRLFTDRVVLDIPIIAMGPNNQPVINIRDLLVDRAEVFFGGSARASNKSLARIETAKAFPQNVEIAYTMPTAGGILKTFHYSISLLPESTGYQPRPADERVGFFTTVYRDLGKFTDEDKWIRYINRWNLEKADPKLKVSPPKEPIVFYIEHSVPVRYRRFVREGLEYWNEAYRKVGIDNAIVVYQQDETSGQHMEKDPEDVRYNFIRWLSNDIGTAIGPSRVHPLTGQILDADVVLTDGWIRYFWFNYNQVLPEMLMEGFSPETMSWLESRPQYDPRILMAPPEKRDAMVAQRMQHGITAYGGHPIAMAQAQGNGYMLGDHEYDGLLGRLSQTNGLCMAAQGKGYDVAMMRMSLDMLDMDDPPADAPKDGDKKDEKKDDKKEDKKADRLDGIPDWFVGPLLKDLVSHEVGHTLGLRHNFKASSVYTFAQLNSADWKDKKPQTGSVMDYTPINMLVTKDGQVHGNYGQTVIGPYDLWAIEYGYGSTDLKEVLKRAAEPELAYATDEDTWGPDPLARRYDFATNPLDYAKSQIDLAKYHRGRLMDKFVKDGQSWARLRRGYGITLGMQVRSVSMMTNWVGTAFINRDRKGDPNGRDPVQVVPAAQQREALKFVIENSFHDDAFGLSPDMLRKMTTDRWLDGGGYSEAMEDPAFPIHDRIMGIQSSVLTSLINPTRMRRLLDNEYRVPADQDAITLAEVMDTLSKEVFSELTGGTGKKFTARQPMVSSLRRNLQRSYIDRLIDLTLPGAGNGAAYNAVSNLAMLKLREAKDVIGKFVDKDNKPNADLDPYTAAHLVEAKVRIEKALEATFVYNAGGGAGGLGFLFGHTTEQDTQKNEPVR